MPVPLDAVIFDMDGTLLDTERVSRDAIYETCERLGYAMTPELHVSMIGSPLDARSAALMEHFGAGFPLDSYHASCDSIARINSRKGIPLRQGARKVLGMLRNRGIPLGLATSTPRPEALERLESSGIMQLLDAIVTRTDVTRGKPHPETFLVAAKLLGARPSHCVAVEDSHLGVRAAVAAGMSTVMIPDLLEATPQIRSICVAVETNLEDLYRQMFPDG